MQYTKKEWLAKGEELFGSDPIDWKFVCPACGKVSSGHHFQAAGGEPSDMYSCCIGRITGKGKTPVDLGHKKTKPEDAEYQKEHGCNWAAFGLFGCLGKGNVVEFEDGGEVGVFAFAENEREE